MSDEQNPDDSPQAPQPDAPAAAADTPQPRALALNAKLADLTVADLNSIIAAETNRAIASRFGNIGRAGAHVNSGPPGFVNGGGHANFDPSHVNSGPPGFVNGGGHANFDPARNLGAQVNVANVGNLANLGRAGVHVNSGPPGFVNGGGHANFDPRTNLGAALVNVTLPDGGQVAIPGSGPVDLQVRGFRITR